MSQKGVIGRPNGKNGASVKITSDERLLIRSALRAAGGSEREAARLLKLRNHAQVGRLLRGEMRSTPELKAAVQRAKVRARKAFCFVKDDAVLLSDVEQIREVVKGAHEALEVAVNRIGAK